MLLQHIERDMSRYEHDENILIILQQVHTYIITHLTNFDSSKQTESYPQRVKEFESKMFKLIDQISSLKGDDLTDKTLRQIKQEILTLMKEIATYKQYLMKQTNTENEKEIGAFINRLEDLQENLADLEYTFSSKFQLTARIGEKVHELVEEDRVSRAKKEHERIALYNEL
jgi:hypothetical protein